MAAADGASGRKSAVRTDAVKDRNLELARGVFRGGVREVGKREVADLAKITVSAAQEALKTLEQQGELERPNGPRGGYCATSNLRPAPPEPRLDGSPAAPGPESSEPANQVSHLPEGPAPGSAAHGEPAPTPPELQWSTVPSEPVVLALEPGEPGYCEICGDTLHRESFHQSESRNQAPSSPP